MKPSRGRGGGITGLLFGGIFSLVVLGGVMGMLKTTGIHDVASGLAYLRGASPKVEQCYKNHGKGCVQVDEPRGSGLKINGAPMTNADLGYSGVKVGSPYISDAIKHTKEEFVETIDSLKTKDVKYDENKISVKATEYPYFMPVKQGSCWSIENEILAKMAMKKSLTFKDVNRNSTKDISKACSITDGKWVDSYTGKKIAGRNKVKLDFVVPIKYAKVHGADKWTKDQKIKFANDKDNFVTVSSESKKERAGKLPADMPIKENKYKCIIAKKYVYVLQKYNLTVDNKNKTALSRQVMSCKK